ncbi:MAG: hypothetical protein DRJ29_13565 [Bacteroidetes bacterium]|nr:MAG: hypothetical protein DRJ29_13565 [Bacteroidota bacterium]
MAGSQVALVIDANLEEPALHGLRKIEQALQSKGHTVTYAKDVVSISADYLILAGKATFEGPASRNLKVFNVPLPEGPEALVIRKMELRDKPALILCGSDDVGLMYAALDVADRISWAESDHDPFAHIQNITEKPFLQERAVSIYTMQRANFEQFLYDETQLERYFDMLAASRINGFVLVFGYENGGFMAPAYPYFFDVEEFPDVTFVGITSEQQAKNTKALRRMIQIAQNRGIRFSPAFWDHIYRGKVQGGGIPGASEGAGKQSQHLVWGVTTENLVDYNKAALMKFMQEFPKIDAIQFRVHWESGLSREETPDFWHDMFSIIKQSRPDLRIDLRAKGLPDQVIEDAISQDLNFRLTTKYWMEQMGLPFHPTHINRQNQSDRRHGYADLLRNPQRYAIHWRLWSGGTTRFLLWGDPDYVRRFAASTQVYDGNSFEINDMLATKMLGEDHDARPFELLSPGYQYYDYEFERYWHFYQTWGRVSYNPEVPAEIWEHEFYSRFGRKSGTALMQGLHLASQVLPRIVAASYPYGNFPTTRGWAEMMRQKDLPDYASAQGSDIQQFMNTADHAQSILDGTLTAMRRPTSTSQWFSAISEQILEKVSLAERSQSGERSKEFISTITDLKILAHLAEYHAHRLLAGVQYNLYKQTDNLFAFDRAIEQEQSAKEAWAGIVDAAGEVYASELIFGVYQVGFSRHWSEQLEYLESGLEQLIADRQNAFPDPKGEGPQIAHVPVRRIKPSESLNIQATVVSRQEISKVEVMVQGTGKYETVQLNPIARGMYEAAVPVPEGSASFNYIIEATDSKGNRTLFPGTGKQDPIHVTLSTDEKAPEVRLERIPKAIQGRDLGVHALVSDPAGINWVRLRYRHLTQFEDYQTVDMQIDPATGLYHAIIPGDFIVPEWNLMYFVEALDSLGNGCMIPDLEKEMPYVIVQIEQ